MSAHPQVYAVHIDCRAQMLRFARLLEILEDVAQWGYNTVLLEYENHFPYQGHLKSIAAPEALTVQQVRQLTRRALVLGIQIIPLVQCLGHLRYVLRLPRFRRLAEGYSSLGVDTICPSENGARVLFRDMVAQVLDYHPECRFFHLGGDEAELDPACPRCLGHGRKTDVSSRLVEHYLERADWIRSLGVEPILWGDLLFAHPQHLERIRGRAIIMDWNYYSGTRASGELYLWGMGAHPNLVPAKPSTWPPLYRSLYRKYIFAGKSLKGRPFPYAKYLYDRGFPFMLAAAARSAGDSFCVPRAPLHLDNVIGAARMVRKYRALGLVVTSWALRRAPWPLTEYALMAGALTLKNPRISRTEIARAFVQNHFGSNDLRLARIPLLLGVDVPNILQSLPQSDLRTNCWLAMAFNKRLEQDRRNQTCSLKMLKTLKLNTLKAERLLALACPKNIRQRERVEFWHWAIQVMGFYAEFGPQLLLGQKPAELPVRLNQLSALSRKIIGRFYKIQTINEEQQNRFGSLEDYLKDR